MEISCVFVTFTNIFIPRTEPGHRHHDQWTRQNSKNRARSSSRRLPKISSRYFPTSYDWILVVAPPPAWRLSYGTHTRAIGSSCQTWRRSATRSQIIRGAHACSPTYDVLIYDTTKPNMWCCRVNGDNSRETESRFGHMDTAGGIPRWAAKE
jgi:hypothetical protein